MTETTSAEASGGGVRGSQASTGNKLQAKSVLTKIAAFVMNQYPFPYLQHWNDRDVAVGRQVQNDSTRSRRHHPARH